MRKVNYTKQGFSYVDVNFFEIVRWGGFGICNGCGKGPFIKMKLIYLLHDTYCDKCFKESLIGWEQFSPEDIAYDLKIQSENHIKWYETLLKEKVVDEKEK